jgi:hypothetical protein
MNEAETDPLQRAGEKENTDEKISVSRNHAESQNQLVYTFTKNTLEEVRANIVIFPKRPRAKYLDLRIWQMEGPSADSLDKPTHKGICLDVELLPQLREAIEAAITAVEKGDARS